MRATHHVLLIVLPVVTGWVGYYQGALRETSVMQMPLGVTVALDQVVSAESFSEVEQARAVLDALARRYVERAQGLIAQEVMTRNTHSHARQTAEGQPILTAIKLLDEAIPEFRGTGAEPQLLWSLLFALRQERLYDRWLDVYLDVLYRHPTDDVVSAFAEDAVAISQAAGRASELISGLHHLNEIPLNYVARVKVERSLDRLCANHQVTDEPDEHHL